MYWHSELYKTKKYHLEKTEMLNNQNIELIHIWEDEWIYKQNIIKSILLNKLNKSRKIYARKCIIKTVNNNDTRRFLNKNHLQGYNNSKINIGLYYNNELVSIMTFGKNRFKKSNDIEMYRYCNKLNYTIIGGANKLFKYFINNFKFDKIITFADRSKFNGKLYKCLNFEFDKYTSINYWYIINNVRSNRMNWQKYKLTKMG